MKKAKMHYVITKVARSGLSATLKVYFVYNDQILYTDDCARLLGVNLTKNDEIRVSGYGLDRAFYLANLVAKKLNIGSGNDVELIESY